VGAFWRFLEAESGLMVVYLLLLSGGKVEGGCMGLTRDFRDGVQARYQGEAKFRRTMLAGAIQSLLSGEGAVGRVAYSGRAGGGTKPVDLGIGSGYWQAAEGRTILRDFINATLGFPALAEKTGIHVKTLHQMFGPKGNPTAAHLFNVIACLQEEEGVRMRVVG
jgi:hypothetical protein